MLRYDLVISEDPLTFYQMHIIRQLIISSGNLTNCILGQLSDHKFNAVTCDNLYAIAFSCAS